MTGRECVHCRDWGKYELHAAHSGANSPVPEHEAEGASVTGDLFPVGQLPRPRVGDMVQAHPLLDGESFRGRLVEGPKNNAELGLWEWVTIGGGRNCRPVRKDGMQLLTERLVSVFEGYEMVMPIYDGPIERAAERLVHRTYTATSTTADELEHTGWLRISDDEPEWTCRPDCPCLVEPPRCVHLQDPTGQDRDCTCPDALAHEAWEARMAEVDE